MTIAHTPWSHIVCRLVLFSSIFDVLHPAGLKASLKRVLLFTCCLFAYAAPAFASHQFLEWPDFGPSAFGLNEPIIISTGAIEFIADWSEPRK
jgi:hypothetical protein